MATSTSETSEMLSSERLQQQSPAPSTRTCSQKQQQPLIAVFSSFGRMSRTKSWLLGILLLLTVATSWPTGTSAAPRRARGLHLILGHRQHRHHQHARSTDPVPSIVPLYTNKTDNRQNCSAMSMTPNTSALIEGRDVAIKTREAVICLTQEWLEHMKNDVLKEAIRKYSYHKLYLKHPLEAEVEKVVFNYETEAFDYIDAEPVYTVEEEMPKIIETLLVVEHLFEEIKFSHKDWNCYFKSFVYFFHHNMHSALRIANQSELCNPGDSQYNKNHIFLNFAAALETIKVLTVMVHKYDQLISNQ